MYRYARICTALLFMFAFGLWLLGWALLLWLGVI